MTANGDHQLRQNPDREHYRDFIGHYYKQLLHPDSYAKLQRVLATLPEPAYVALLEQYNENLRKNFHSLRTMEPVTPEQVLFGYARAKIEFYSLRFIIEIDKLSLYQFQEEESGYGSKSIKDDGTTTPTRHNAIEQNTIALIKIIFFHALTSKTNSANLALVELEQLCSRRQLTLNALYQKYRTKLLKLIIEALLMKLTANENQLPQINGNGLAKAAANNGSNSPSKARYVHVCMGRALQVFNMVKLSSDEIAESLIIITNLVHKEKYSDDAFRQILKYLKYINTDISFFLKTHIHQVVVALLLRGKMSHPDIKNSIIKLCELCDTYPKVILTGRFELIKSRLLLQYCTNTKAVTDAMCFVAQLELKEDEQPFDDEFDEEDKFMGYVNRCLVGILLSVDAHFSASKVDLGSEESICQIGSLCKILTMLSKDQVKASHVKLLSTLSSLIRLRPRRDNESLNIAIKELWGVFVSKLDSELRTSLLINICVAMYELIEDCPEQVSTIYQELICQDKAKKNAEKLKSLFFIPDVPAMKKVYNYVSPHVRRTDIVSNLLELHNSIRCVLPLLKLESQRCRTIGLTKIKQLLHTNRDLLVSTMLTNLDEPLNETIAKTIEILISMSSTQGAEYSPLIAECLGIIGAVNPIRLDQLIYGGISNDSLVVKDLNESNFVAKLIEKLKNALFSDQVSESEVASYALQAVVEKFRVLENKNIISKISVEAIKACEICQTTNYCATRKDLQNSSQAVYESLKASKQHSYTEWLDKFSMNIITSIPDKVIQEVLTACTYLFKCNLKLAEFLMPHVVVYLISITSDKLSYIRKEIWSIMDENIGLSSQDLDNVYSDDIRGGLQAFHYQCANMVFCIVDAIERFDCSIKSKKPLTQTQEAIKLNAKQSQALEKMLHEIPKDKLALLASRCRSHTRALRYFEDFLYQSQSKDMFDKYATSLQKIHIALDDTFDAAGIPMLRNSPTTLVDDIANYEACGRFDRAFVCCTTSLDAKNMDTDGETLIEDSLQCLSQQGDYHRLLEKTRQYIYDFPQFKRDLLPYAIEAEWKLGRWDELNCTFETEHYDCLLESASVSQGLLMRVANCTPGEIPESLNTVRQRLMRPLSIAMMDRSAYFRGYQSLLILHSIEDFALTSELFENEMLQTQKGNENIIDIKRSRMLKHFDSILDSWAKRSKLVEPSLKSFESVLAWQRSICMCLERKFPLLSSRISVDIGQSWLTSSGFCREAGSFDRSFYCLVQAQRWFGSEFDRLDLDLRVKFHIEQAQLDWEQGDKTKAIRSLKLSLERLKNHKLYEHLRIRNSKPEPNRDLFPRLNDLEPCKDCEQFTLIDRESFARLKTLLTHYCEEAAAEIPETLFFMYEECVHLGVNQEETYFRLARYYDRLLAYYMDNPKLCSRQQELADTQKFSQSLMTGSTEEVYTKLMEHSIIAFGNSLKYGVRYLRESMPRMLNIWYDLGSKTSKGIQSGAARSINSRISSTVRFIEELKTKHLPPYYFMTAISILLSRVAHPHSYISQKTCEIIELLLVTYPHQLSWQMQALFNEETNSDRKKIAKQFRDKIPKQYPQIDKIVRDTSYFSKILQDLCFSFSPADKRVPKDKQLLAGNFDLKTIFPSASKFDFQQLKIIAPMQASMRAILPMSNSCGNLKNHEVFPAKYTSFIQSICAKFRVFNSLQRPKQIFLMCDNGKQVSILCKQNDDLRKDSRCIEFLDLLNRVLRRDNQSNARFFEIQTFLVLPLKPDCGIIEMVPNCNSLKNLIEPLMRERDNQFQMHESFPKRKTGDYSAAEKQKMFISDVLPKVNPPILPIWLRRTFTEPTSWYMARLAYTRTTAVISMGGYIIGLGDRHLDNVLIDTCNGRIVHVDFNLLFHQGETLPTPEIVPFRLTQNVVAAFGSLGTEGNFRKVCEIVMRVMRKEKDSLLTTLKPFMHDPCSEWTKNREPKGRSNKEDVEERYGENKSAKFRIEVTERKLKGFPRSPNFKPLTLIDSYSVEAQVDNLIMEATDNNNLALMYWGWAPHI